MCVIRSSPFENRITTSANLDRLNEMGIKFMTLRRRSKGMLREIHRKPMSAWRRIELEGVTRAYRTPRILDEKIGLKDYAGAIRQLTITDLGHEEPTLLLTNHWRLSAAKLTLSKACPQSAPAGRGVRPERRSHTLAGQ